MLLNFFSILNLISFRLGVHRSNIRTHRVLLQLYEYLCFFLPLQHALVEGRVFYYNASNNALLIRNYSVPLDPVTLSRSPSYSSTVFSFIYILSHQAVFFFLSFIFIRIRIIFVCVFHRTMKSFLSNDDDVSVNTSVKRKRDENV